jgi:hypothetical protein
MDRNSIHIYWNEKLFEDKLERKMKRKFPSQHTFTTTKQKKKKDFSALSAINSGTKC